MAIENLAVSNYANITVEEYATIAKELIKEQFSSGYYIFPSEDKVLLGANEYLRISAKSTYSVQTIRQYMYLRKVGLHMIVITATTSKDVAPETFEAMFS